MLLLLLEGRISGGRVIRNCGARSSVSKTGQSTPNPLRTAIFGSPFHKTTAKEQFGDIQNDGSEKIKKNEKKL